MIEVSLWRLALLLIPLVMVGWVSFRWVGKSGELVVATGRMVVQLLLVGYVLMWLFQVDGPWVTLGVVGFMILVSSWIAVRTVKSMKGKAFVDAVMAILIGGGSVFTLVLFGVLGLDPWYEPRYAIPLAGMIFANAMTAVTLSAERFDAEREGGKGRAGCAKFGLECGVDSAGEFVFGGGPGVDSGDDDRADHCGCGTASRGALPDYGDGDDLWIGRGWRWRFF